MIHDRLIVCLASAWDYDPTSKHHLMRILSRRNHVLWINYHGTRRPAPTRSDLRDAFSAVVRVARGLRRVTPTMTQLTPLVIPGANGTALERLHRRLLTAQIRRAIRKINPAGDKPVQVWTFAPDLPFLKGALGEECFVYYCVDEYTRFKGFDAAAIKAAEDELLVRADLVVTTSEPLLVTKRIRRPDAILIPHGVDYDHFAAAWRSPQPRPHDLAAINAPIFGFFGLIHHWIDRALIARVARLRPDYAFVLIGDCKSDIAKLRNLANVYLIGRRPYATLPAYCSAFNAGLLPFVQNTMTRSINPIKMMEYLAAGLPVISTPLPAAERFLGPVAIAASADDFAIACDAALAPQNADRQRISLTVRDHTWESRINILSELVSRAAQRSVPQVPANSAVSRLVRGASQVALP